MDNPRKSALQHVSIWIGATSRCTPPPPIITDLQQSIGSSTAATGPGGESRVAAWACAGCSLRFANVVPSTTADGSTGSSERTVPGRPEQPGRIRRISRRTLRTKSFKSFGNYDKKLKKKGQDLRGRSTRGEDPSDGARGDYHKNMILPFAFALCCYTCFSVPRESRCAWKWQVTLPAAWYDAITK